MTDTLHRHLSQLSDSLVTLAKYQRLHHQENIRPLCSLPASSFWISTTQVPKTVAATGIKKQDLQHGVACCSTLLCQWLYGYLKATCFFACLHQGTYNKQQSNMIKSDGYSKRKKNVQCFYFMPKAKITLKGQTQTSPLCAVKCQE